MELYSELLKSVAISEGVENPNITITPAPALGEGFLGIYYVAEIKGKDRCLHLFLKRPPHADNKERQEVLRNIHLNEFLFYDRIYPEFVKFEEQMCCNNIFNSVAKCYKTVYEKNKEVVVLDNMKIKGYKSYNKKEPLDDAHMKLVLEEMAHLHAISFALKDKYPHRFKKLAEQIKCVYDEGGRIDLENTVEYICKHVLGSLETSFYGYKTYEFFVNNIRQFLNSIDLLSEDFKIITHGDITRNNVLFNYHDEHNPRIPGSVCVLDWQLTKVTSPVMDVSYFFYAACNKEQMANIEYYLQFYYNKLCYYITNMGGNPNSLYPREKFVQQWTSLARYGLAMSFLVIKTLLTEPSDLSTNRNTNAKKSMLENLSYKIENEKLYRKRTKSIIEHFIEKGYLEPLDKITT